MTLELIQKQINNNSLPNALFLIFQNSENSFISNQYINAISSLKEIKIIYVDDLKGLFPDENDIMNKSFLFRVFNFFTVTFCL